VLHVDMSILQGAVDPPDLSKLQRIVLLLNISTLQRLELSLSLSTLLRPLLLQDSIRETSSSIPQYICFEIVIPAVD
jgi:hypothetical protein